MVKIEVIKKILRYIIFFCVIIALFAWFNMTKHNTNCSEHVSVIKGLDVGPEASDISHFKLRTIADGRQVYEFTITEEGFLGLAARLEWIVEEIKAGDVITIGRYTKHCKSEDEVTTANISDGYYYGIKKKDGKSELKVGYDRKKERAYVYERRGMRERGKSDKKLEKTEEPTEEPAEESKEPLIQEK